MHLSKQDEAVTVIHQPEQGLTADTNVGQTANDKACDSAHQWQADVSDI